MKKGETIEMDEGNMRLNPKAEKVIEEAEKMTNVRKAFELLARLIGMPVEEICAVKKYNPRTGNPAEFRWKPEKWDGIIWFCWSNTPNISEDSALHKAILKEFPAKSTTIVKRGGARIAVKHVPEQEEGGWESGGTSPAHLLFSKIVKI